LEASIVAQSAPNFAVVRVISYGVALELLPATLNLHAPGRYVGLPIHFREIDEAALSVWKSHWQGFSVGYGGHPWDQIATNYQVRFPARFEIAVWCGPVVCGFGVGLPDDSHFLSVRLMEGSPDPRSPLRGAIRYAVVEAAGAYAKALGKTELRLNRPRQALLTLYQQMGFTLVPPHHPYCWMTI
jgi:hypothetical protein